MVVKYGNEITEKSIRRVLQFLVNKTFNDTDLRPRVKEIVESKLFSFVEFLSKYKWHDTAKKGFSKHNQLWIKEVNDLVTETLNLEENSVDNSVKELHQKYIEFADQL